MMYVYSSSESLSPCVVVGVAVACMMMQSQSLR